MIEVLAFVMIGAFHWCKPFNLKLLSTFFWLHQVLFSILSTPIFTNLVTKNIDDDLHSSLVLLCISYFIINDLHHPHECECACFLYFLNFSWLSSMIVMPLISNQFSNF
ncbi:uncharacterized protein DS421_16g554500 [Arachis hypogaea]|nr:uncharacterized protein DS421_16g554500 [Arachis hypogaea]